MPLPSPPASICSHWRTSGAPLSGSGTSRHKPGQRADKGGYFCIGNQSFLKEVWASSILQPRPQSRTPSCCPVWQEDHRATDNLNATRAEIPQQTSHQRELVRVCVSVRVCVRTLVFASINGCGINTSQSLALVSIPSPCNLIPCRARAVITHFTIKPPTHLHPPPPLAPHHHTHTRPQSPLPFLPVRAESPLASILRNNSSPPPLPTPSPPLPSLMLKRQHGRRSVKSRGELRSR